MSVLTPEEEAELTARKEKLQADVIDLEQALVDIDAVQVPENDETEALNKKVYDDFHIGIITSYETELKNINGSFIISPVSESDYTDRTVFAGRLYDPGQTITRDIIRIPEFDGGNTSGLTDYEIIRPPQYTAPLDRLQNGLGSSNSFDELTDSVITSSVSSFFLSDSVSSTVGLSVGNEISVSGPGGSFIGTINNIGSTSGPPPPIEIGFDFVTPLAGSIAAGGRVLADWNGFDNNERTQKESNYKEIMDFYVAEIDGILAAQLGFISGEKTALASNTDDALDQSAVDATNQAFTDYTNYKVTIDISDSGITGFNALNTSRGIFLTGRAAAIVTTRDTNTDLRFFWAAERAGFEGSLMIGKQLLDGKDAIQAQIDDKNADIAALEAQGF